ncbi:MAG: choice-of-anchor D domain-containing protein [Candidatus Eisenbacteria bacterium]|nr:choice-of-anchor D domain-containing protein [Candidatus Eisenbacteria bacterium]
MASITGSRVLLALAAILCAALSFSSARSQGYNAVHSSNGTDVWAVGDQGRTVRSLDGGASWASGALGALPLQGVAARGFTVLVAGDSGRVWRSLDSGGQWTLTTLAGAPPLGAIQMPDDSVAFVAGARGVIAKSANGGRTWAAMISGTFATIRSLRFRDARHGWAVGDSGTALQTDDGGATWKRIAVPAAGPLRSVDAWGGTVWIAGDGGQLLRSLDGGAHWSALDLHLDPTPDLSSVWIENAARVIVAGGGGFMRATGDSGATWTFFRHPLVATVDAMFFANAGVVGWAVSRHAQTIERTADAGATWTLAPGTSTAGTQWVRKLAFSSLTGGVRGSTIVANGRNPSTLYVVLGITLYRSRDRGETWQSIGTLGFPGYGPDRTNSFWVSPRDSNRMVAATQEGPDMVMRSVDGGLTWTQSLARDFSEYGSPLEMNADHPDTLLFAPEDGSLYRSLDFGATWETLSNPGFRSPCDVQIVPGDDRNVWVGDGVTGVGQGEIWQSRDGGLTFSKRYPVIGDVTAAGSEIPSMACSRLDPRLGFAAHWVSGGMSRTLDGGHTWTQMTGTFAAWGTEFAHDDPNVGLFGVYSGARSYQTWDAGASFTNFPLTSQNYAFFLPDRSTFFAQQGDGVYRFVPNYSLPAPAPQALTLTAPLGGESWAAGAAHDITWSAAGVAVARIEYRPNAAAPWTVIADEPGYAGRHAWTIPDTATSDARVRVRDRWDGAPADSSALFTIATPRLAATPVALAFGTRPVGSTALDSLRLSNAGTAPVAVTALIDAPGFAPTRASFALAPGASDTLGLRFVPVLPVHYVATVTLISNAPGPPATIALTGAASDTLHLALISPVGGEEWQFGTTRWIQWQSAQLAAVAIDYESSPNAWTALADSVPAAAERWAWSVPEAPGAASRVRVREWGGGALDSSAAPFSITVPELAISPAILDLDAASSGSGSDTLHVANTGTGSLVVSWVASDRATFRPGRTFVTLLPGSSDSLSITFTPVAAGFDSATLTLTANDPVHTHTLRVRGHTVPPLSSGPGAPAAFALDPAFPNPLAATALIRYALPRRSEVTLEVFDLQGERVATLVRGTLDAGDHQALFRAVSEDGRALPSGVYFCRLRAGNFSASRKMLVMR